jgi:hypothetical protein
VATVFILASILDAGSDLSSLVVAALVFAVLYLFLKGLEHA